jgi:hypothetical protein
VAAGAVQAALRIDDIAPPLHPVIKEMVEGD